MSDQELVRDFLILSEMSQQELADKLHFNRSNISKVVNGKQKLSTFRRWMIEEELKQAYST